MVLFAKQLDRLVPGWGSIPQFSSSLICDRGEIWYMRYLEGVVSKDVWVRIPPVAPIESEPSEAARPAWKAV